MASREPQHKLIEWWTALAAGSEADSFLATQGDVWDTQWDMFPASIGCLAAQLTLAGRHDRQLERMVSAASASTRSSN